MTTPLPMYIAFDGLSGIDGSARFAFCNTTALASVSGPIPARLATEHPIRAALDVHVRPLASVPRVAEKHTAAVLRGVLERACVLGAYPRTGVQVVVQTLSPAASTKANADVEIEADVRLAAQINAAGLACLNAGSVAMRGVVCAVAVAVTASALSRPALVADFDRFQRKGTNHVAHAGCFAFLFGVDRFHSSHDDPRPSSPPPGLTQTMPMLASNIPPAKMIWTNYRARPGEAFSLDELGEAEKVALEGAKMVWRRIKESISV